MIVKMFFLQHLFLHNLFFSKNGKKISTVNNLHYRLFFHYTEIWDPLIISSGKPNRNSSIDNIQC